MKQPGDMVDVCRIISDQLELLGVNDIRNVQTAIINEQKVTYLNYQYFAAYKEGVIEETNFNKHPTVFAMVEEMKKSANSTFSGIMKGKELVSFREWRKQNHQFPDPILDEVDTAHYYFYSIGLGGLGLTTYKQLNSDGLEIFRRFHNVFSLAYRRFIDIEKAEAQAREAMIEGALERVRGRSMAMHKSDELLEAGELLYSELSKLGMENLTCGYVLMDEDEKVGWNYGVNPVDGTIKPQPTGVPKAGTKILESITESWKKQEPSLLFELDEEETIEHQTYIAENSLNFPISAEKLLSISPKRLVIHTFNFKHGYLLIVGAVVLNANQQEMVTRFAKVFEQTYTRFLDLKKQKLRQEKHR